MLKGERDVGEGRRLREGEGKRGSRDFTNMPLPLSFLFIFVPRNLGISTTSLVSSRTQNSIIDDLAIHRLFIPKYVNV